MRIRLTDTSTTVAAAPHGVPCSVTVRVMDPIRAH